MIPLKKPKMQGAKFSRNKAYLAYVAMTGKLKQRRRLGFSAESNMSSLGRGDYSYACKDLSIGGGTYQRPR